MAAAASCLLTEDQFLCSICLDVFTDPVTVPCGHNFCRNCITQYWDSTSVSRCPNCKKVFYVRPELQVNTFISEMAARFRELVQQKGTESRGSSRAEKQESKGKKAELEKTEAELQQMIQKRRVKVKELKRSVKLSQEAADREMAEGVEVFSALKESVERSQDQLMATITEKQRKTEEQAEGFIRELEEEISELEKRSSEVEQLSQSEDHLHLLQSFLSLNAAPPTKDWTQVSVPPPSYEGTVMRALAQLEEELSHQMKKLPELKKVQQHEVEVTLDPDTAQPKLILSDDGREVHDSDVKKKLPNNPERFDSCPCVLAKQSFSSGRFYYEVQVKGKTEWDLGVAKESINRKGKITLSSRRGYWTIWLRNENEYEALDHPRVPLSLKHGPEKVGVFVDYEEGLVSFYDVDAAALIYSFTGCCFTEKLYPYFCPCPNDGGKNAAPLIISPVKR